MPPKGAKTTPGTSPKKITKKRPSSAKARRKAAAKLAKAVDEQGEQGEEEEKDEEEEDNPPNEDVELGESGLEPSQIIVGHRHAINEFKLGHVIVTAMHEAQFEDLSMKPADRKSGQVTYTRYGPIYSKPRKLVVIARYPEHMVCLPIYTNRGTGLRNKENKEHYMGVRDAEYYGGEKNEAPHGPCLIVERRLQKGPKVPKDHISVLSDKSYVHLTRPGQ
ncbi:hypothetical protein DL98DRAFT_593420 [Cadophora sp. DSE1049]|nr:hypothetical protein DL98DRAFT_593420 [Cadophora sp. DSE1049]